MRKPRVNRSSEVQFTVIADKRVRDRLKVLGTMAGTNLSREAGRRLAESVKRDGSSPITLCAMD